MAEELGAARSEVSGTVWGNVVQARDIVVNVHRAAGDVPPSALDSYLRAVQSSAQEHPVAPRSSLTVTATVPLGDVYVDQKLRVTLGHDSRSNSMPPDTWRELLDSHRHLVVVAGPGGGKSSLLRHIARALVEQHMAGQRPTCIPVLVHARAFRRGLPLADAIRDGAVAELGHRLLRDLPKDVFAAAADGSTPWLVLVDGLDEVISVRDRETVIQAIVEGTQHPFLRFVVATRPLPMADLVHGEHGFRYCELEPFDLPMLGRFAERWLARHGLPNALELSGHLQEHARQAGIRSWANRPLAATMLCALLARAPDQPLPENSAHLYDQYVHKLLMLRDTNAERKTLQDIVGLLEEIAIRRQLGDVDQPMLDLALELVRGSTLEPSSADAEVQAYELHDTLCGTGLVVSTMEDVEFAHETLEEYFAARHVVATLAGLPEAERLSEIQSLVDDLAARQASFFTDYLSDASPFFRWSELPRFLIDLWTARGNDVGSLLCQLVRSSAEHSWRLIDRLRSEGVLIPPVVADDLVTVTTNPLMEPDNDVAVARLLADLKHTEGLARLLAMAVDADRSDSNRIAIMRVIVNRGPVGAAALSFLMGRHDFPDWEFPYSRVDAVDLMPQVDDEDLVEGLALLMENERLDEIVRVHAAALAVTNDATFYRRLLSLRFASSLTGLLGDAAARGALEAFTVLWHMVDDLDLAPDKRLGAANELHILDEDAGASAFRALADDPHLAQPFRQLAAKQLQALN